MASKSATRPATTPVKKTVAKTAKPSAGKSKSTNLKYADKSVGQPELAAIFESIKEMMTRYDGKASLKLHAPTGGQANLVSHKPVVIGGRKRDELWFVSALVQKGYVGFYYMPIYMNDPMKKLFSPEFIQCLKGKACFHIKKASPSIMEEIEKAIRIGYDSYVKRGWV